MLNWFRWSRKPIRHFSSGKPIKELLKQIIISDGGPNLLDAGIVQSYEIGKDESIKITVKVSRDFRKIRSMIEDKLGREGYKDIQVLLIPTTRNLFEKHANLKNISSVLVVTGAIGKSTVARGIARALFKKQLKIGLLECDLLAPTLHCHKQFDKLSLTQELFNPMDIEGLKCMSLGFFGDVAASPLILSRMLTHTKWDNLDYLVIDASEKDLQSIALTELKINGGIVVKQVQHDESFLRILRLFTFRQIQLTGVVQNLPLLKESQSNDTRQVLDRNNLTFLSETLGVKNILSLPILNNGLKDTSAIFSGFTESLVQILKEPKMRHIVHYNTTTQRIEIILNGKILKKLKPFDIRYASAQKDDTKRMDPQVFPSTIRPIGNFAVQIDWSDGQKQDIYAIQKLVRWQGESG